jgi:hypothetical protein
VQGSSLPSPNIHTLRSRLAKLQDLQDGLPLQPYGIILRLRIAAAYKSLGYPDLAAGDAYKALLLVDEVVQEGEYHEQASEAAQSYIVSGEASEYAAEIHQAYSNFDHSGCRCQSPASSNDEGDDVVSWAKDCWSRTAFALLVGCLTDCGCLRSAFDYNGRALKAFGQVQPFDIYQRTLTERLRLHFESTGEKLDDIDIKMYPDKGVVRRELYPWNKHEPDRYSDETILFLNKEMTAAAPKLEIKVAELPVLSSGSSPMDQDVYYVKQLGVFAKEDIPADEIILQEKSLLTAVSRLHELYCNACSGSLPKPDPNTESVAISCEECEDVFFCSEECHDFAQEQYHPVLCGVSTEQKVPPNEAADWLYTLLLVRALALAEVQDVHPLDLKEVGYIWGDYHGLDLDEAWKADANGHLTDPFASVKQSLSFSFNNNILLPLNMLEKMDVNIFEQSHRYDTWIFNTLYAKFRGRLGMLLHESHQLIRNQAPHPHDTAWMAVLKLQLCIHCGV